MAAESIRRSCGAKRTSEGCWRATTWPRCPTSRSIHLIFSAGFSTAAEVSDISGRGVGMDVVRTTVEQIGGRVSLTSRVGAGTTVRLDLPDDHRHVAHHGG